MARRDAVGAVLLSLLVLIQPLAEARGGGFGGRGGFSAGRGVSAARGASPVSRGGGMSMGRSGISSSRGAGSFGQPGAAAHPGGNFQSPGAAGVHPNYNQNGARGFGAGGFQNQQDNKPHWNSQPHFTSGNSFGSPSRASTFKHALAGAAIGTIGGMLAFEAGKAIIRSATTPFNHDGRDYYFDRQNYRGNQANMCAMPLQQLIDTNAAAAAPTTTAAPVTNENGTVVAAAPTAQNVLQTVQYPDGTRPKEVVWSCPAGQMCCGTDCCPAPQASANPNAGGHSSHSNGPGVGTIILLILLFLLILSCCCCFLLYKFCRESIECILPKREENYYEGGQKYDDPNAQPGQSYPMNPYPPQQPQPYPPQQSYQPQQPYPPQQSYYPPPPNAQGGYPAYPNQHY